LLWPLPKHFDFNSASAPAVVSPCEIRYNVSSPISDYVSAIVDFYLDSVFHCGSKKPNNYTLTILVRSSNMTLPT
jgi:hexosaminidase